LLKKICPLLPECAAAIGDVQVRNKGTIGGSLAHSDPAGDWPAAIIALNAEMVAASKSGERTIKADDFFVDLLTTALEPGEILREIRISKPNGRSGQAYAKMHHPASGFAVVGVAANLSLDADASCQKANIGITGVSSKAYRAASVEAGLNAQNWMSKRSRAPHRMPPMGGCQWRPLRVSGVSTPSCRSICEARNSWSYEVSTARVSGWVKHSLAD